MPLALTLGLTLLVAITMCKARTIFAKADVYGTMLIDSMGALQFALGFADAWTRMLP